ncbi:hypothetical protein PJL15_02903 [Paenarthrobacter nitroguajacolicus]|nr:hypothetical protein [Paenarthrobacter nitroguajacolicus]
MADFATQNSTLKPRPTMAQVTFSKSLLEPGTKVLIFGDSWAQGYAATPISRGFAYLIGETFGWDAEVVHRGGTGYTNPGPQDVGTYAQSIAALQEDPTMQLVMIQGGLNDIYGGKSTDVATAASAAWAAAQERFPNAQIVVLGPAQSTKNIQTVLREIDGNLRMAADHASLPYISPINEVWINAQNYDDVFNVEAFHPDTDGHAYFAKRLEEDIRTLATK